MDKVFEIYNNYIARAQRETLDSGMQRPHLYLFKDNEFFGCFDLTTIINNENNKRMYLSLIKQIVKCLHIDFIIYIARVSLWSSPESADERTLKKKSRRHDCLMITLETPKIKRIKAYDLIIDKYNKIADMVEYMDEEINEGIISDMMGFFE